MDEYSPYTKRFEAMCACSVRMTITDAASVASIHEYTTAEIVSDLFHVAQVITGAVDTVRRQEFTKADAATRKKFKQKRFLMLKRRRR